MKDIRAFVLLLAASFACVLAWGAIAPVRFDSREEVFVIPKGTWARRMAGDKVEILPPEIRLTLGMRDVLVLRNHDDVPQQFGPTLLMPGQSFSLPFEKASTYSFACTAHLNGQLLVIVQDKPDTPWQRLAWRANKAWQAIA
jgi:hypothetical protein